MKLRILSKAFQTESEPVRKELKGRNVLEKSCYEDAGMGERAEGMVRQPQSAHQQEAIPGREGQGESGSQAAWRATIIASAARQGLRPKAGGEAAFSTALQASTDHTTKGPADMEACRGSVSRGSEWEKMGGGPKIKQAQVHESPPESGLYCHGALVEPGMS